MSIVKAMIMGLVQGLTEFLPISSSGHLVIFNNILGLNLEGGVLFEIVLHIGTLFAIVIVYFKDIANLLKEGIFLVKDIMNLCINKIKNRNENISIVNTAKRKLLLLIIVASFPTAIIGLLLKDVIENLLSRSLLTTGLALLITGTLLLISDKIIPGNRNESKATYVSAFFVGIVQGLAVVPGISRSGSTIVAGLFSNFSKDFAIKFSFLVSLPAVGGASLLKIAEVLKNTSILKNNFMYLIVGLITSSVIGYFCIKALIVLLKQNKFHLFTYYCWAVGLLCIIYSGMKVL